MPCCGSTTRERKRWPHHAARTFLSVIQNRDTLVDEGAQVRFVFLAAMLESLLEPVVFRLLSARQSGREAQKTLSMVHGAAKLRELYNRYSDKPLASLFQGTSYRNFTRQWDRVIQLRNKFAHGEVVTIGPVEQALAGEVEAAAFGVFAAVHNDVVRQCSRMPDSSAQPDGYAAG